MGALFLNGGFILSLLVKPLHALLTCHICHTFNSSRWEQELADHVKRREGAEGGGLGQVSLKTLPSKMITRF